MRVSGIKSKYMTSMLSLIGPSCSAFKLFIGLNQFNFKIYLGSGPRLQDLWLIWNHPSPLRSGPVSMRTWALGLLASSGLPFPPQAPLPDLVSVHTWSSRPLAGLRHSSRKPPLKNTLCRPGKYTDICS